MSAAAEGAERTLRVTVLKADISGSTPLGARLDPEELRSVLGSYFAALAREIGRQQGIVDKYIGDAVIAVFGIPEPRDDDAIRAVLAAIGMQESLARENDALEKKYGLRLACRIGVNTGDVVAGAVAGDVQSAFTVIGETVTVAERLEAAAALDTVLVGEATYAAARDAFRWEPMAPVTVKGRSEPVPAYRPVGVLRQALPADAPFAATALPDVSRSLQIQGAQDHVLAEERKIVTVLFADLASSVPLGAKLGPAELRDVLGGYFSVVARAIGRYGGTIDKYVGDAVMAVFGAPVSHEDDAARAIAAALAIQRGTRELRERLARAHDVEIALKIGINTGEVVAGLLPGEVRAYTVTGDAVNTAQRIESVAPPNAILVSDTTRALARKAYAFEAVPPLTLKGKAEPIPAFLVAGTQAADTRPAAAMVGRDRELAALVSAYHAAASGRGQLVHLSGEAGIGKTRLLAELLEVIPERTLRVHARATSYEQATPYALVADLVRRLFTVPADEDEPSARAALEKTLDVVEAAAREAAIAVLLGVLGYEVRSPLDPQGRRRLVVSVLRSSLERRSAAAPLVMLLEDLHWVDPTSAELLRELTTVVPTLGCLVLSTSRQPGDAPWPAQRVELDSLPRDAAAQLIDRLTAAPLDDAMRTAVLDRTAGNPFFIEEVVRSLGEGSATVPATVQELLEARLDALEASPRQVVQRAAVIGRVFAKGILSRVAPDPDLDSALAALERQHMVDQVSVSPDPVYSFPHALVQEVVYRTQLLSQRRRSHVSVGDAYTELFAERLEDYTDTLAFHYRRGEDDLKARTWLLRAGQRAQRLYAHAEAVDYLADAVVRSADDAESRADAHEGLADVHRVTGAYGQALDTYGVALASPAAGDVVRRCRLLRKSGFVHYLKGDANTAAKLFAQVLAELPPDAPAERARTLQNVGEMRWREGDYEPAIAHLRDAVAEAERAGDDDARAEALKQLGTAHVQKGDLAAARDYYEQSLALYERIGDLLGQGNMHNNLGAVARRESRLDDAVARYAQALAIRQRIGDQAGLVIANSNLGEIAYLRGDLEAARRHYETAAEIARAIGFATGLALALTGLGATKVHLGEGDEGRRDLLEGIAEMERSGNRAFLVDVLRDAVQAHLASDPRLALEMAERTYAIAQELGSSERLGIGLQTLGLAREANGDPAGALEALEQSRTMLDSAAERQELARTLGALGRVYALLPEDDRRRGDAAPLVSQAREILVELGATLDLRNLDRALAQK